MEGWAAGVGRVLSKLGSEGESCQGCEYEGCGLEESSSVDPSDTTTSSSVHICSKYLVSMTLQHLREILKSSPALIDDAVEPLCASDISDYNLVASRNQALVCSVGELINRHAHLPAVWTAVIVQLSLNNWGRELYDLDI